jgi:hypothetical protein
MLKKLAKQHRKFVKELVKNSTDLGHLYVYLITKTWFELRVKGFILYEDDLSREERRKKHSVGLG